MKFDAPHMRGVGIEENAFVCAYLGSNVFVIDPRTGRHERARYIVADELTAMASEAALAGRPDRCGLLNSIVSKVRLGRPISKRQAVKAQRELLECKHRLARRKPRAETVYPFT